jgi:hypothetical protein
MRKSEKAIAFVVQNTTIAIAASLSYHLRATRMVMI